MRLATALLALSAAVLLGGCHPKKQPVVHAAPPPPKPAAPPAPPRPLSIPQTNVELPPPQPVPPDAIPAPDASVTPPPPVAPSRPITGPRRTGSQTPRTEPPATTPVGPTPPPVEAAPPRAPISEVLPATELKRLQDEADARIQETKQLIANIPQRRQNQQRNLVGRIEAFLKQAEEAKGRGDMRQASELAGRALVLARELKP